MFISVGTWKRIFTTIEILEKANIVGNGRDAYCQQYVFPGLLVTARYPLKFHVQKHREAFNHMMRAAQYIDYVPPNESTRVRRLLKSITCSALESTKDVISNDAAKKGDFELMADYMLERSEEKSIKSKTH